MYRRDLLKSAGVAIGGAALLTADTAIADQRADAARTRPLA